MLEFIGCCEHSGPFAWSTTYTCDLTSVLSESTKGITKEAEACQGIGCRAIAVYNQDCCNFPQDPRITLLRSDYSAGGNPPKMTPMSDRIRT
jgi:hypothetical protein